MRKRFVWLVVAFVCFFYLIQFQVNIASFGRPLGLCDFEFHLDKIKGSTSEFTSRCYIQDNEEVFNQENVEEFEKAMGDYPSLIHYALRGLGINTPILLFLFMLLLIIVFPVWLFVEKVNPYAGFIWVCFSSVHLQILQSTIPQACVVALFILYLLKFRKNYYFLGLLCLISFGLHRHAIYFYLPLLFLELLEDFFKGNKFVFAPIVIPNFELFNARALAWIPDTLLVQVPFWLIFIARKRILTSITFAGLILFSIWASLLVSFRITFIAQIILTIILAQMIQKQEIRFPKILLLSMFLFLIFYLIYFYIKNYEFFFLWALFNNLDFY